MANLLSVVSGWTGLLGPFTLKVDGTPLNLTGYTVTLVVKTSLGVVVALGGTVALRNQTSFPGQVTYTPVATDFVWETGSTLERQPYTIHWKVVDGPGQIVYFPNGAADEISVYRA